MVTTIRVYPSYVYTTKFRKIYKYFSSTTHYNTLCTLYHTHFRLNNTKLEMHTSLFNPRLKVNPISSQAASRYYLHTIYISNYLIWCSTHSTNPYRVSGPLLEPLPSHSRHYFHLLPLQAPELILFLPH